MRSDTPLCSEEDQKLIKRTALSAISLLYTCIKKSKKKITKITKTLVSEFDLKKRLNLLEKGIVLYAHVTLDLSLL